MAEGSVVVGDRRQVPAKRCPACGASGEWPGQPCPTCKSAPPGSRTSTLAQLHQRSRLHELATIANEAHAQLVLRGRELIDHAISSGDALLEARRAVERGGWLDWMERELQMHPTTAYRYMRIAEHQDEVRRSLVESVEQAIQILADLPRRGHGPRGYSDADKAQWTQLVDEIGVKRTAGLLGVAASTISKWASPDSPHRGRVKPRPVASASISEHAIERLAQWLVGRFGGDEYPVSVTLDVRADALQALERALGTDPTRGA